MYVKYDVPYNLRALNFATLLLSEHSKIKVIKNKESAVLSVVAAILYGLCKNDNISSGDGHKKHD